MNKFLKATKRFKETKYLLKFVSLFLSLFLWFFVLKSQPIEIEEKLSVKYDIPLGFSFFKKPPSEVMVAYRGLRANLRRSDVRKNKIKINIPLKNGSRYIVKEDITNDDIPKPAGVTIERFRPKKYELYLEKMIKKRVKIIPRFIGTLPRGVTLQKTTVFPKEVLISGAYSLMKNISSIETSDINLSKIGLDKREVDINLVIPNLITLEELDSPSARLELDILPIHPIEKEIEVPIHFIVSEKSKFRPLQNKVKIVISFLEEDFTEDTEEYSSKIRAFADLTKFTGKNTELIKINVDAPSNLKIVKVIPELITVKER